MNRQNLFVMLAQTHVLSAVHNHARHLELVYEASLVPEEAIPSGIDIVAAVRSFAEWVQDCKPEMEKPLWLKEYEEASRAVCIRLTDYEAEDWWFDARKLAVDASPVVKNVIMKVVLGNDTNVLAHPDEAHAFREWMQSMPSFDYDEPPFIFEEVGAA
jgi:hypothetical protein